VERKEINLIDFWNIIWKWKKLLISIVIIFTIISIGVSLMLPKWYKASAVILSPGKNDSPLSSMSILSDFGMGGLLGGDQNVFRYLAILKSRNLKDKVIKKFDFQKNYGLSDMDLIREEFEKNLKVDVGDENQVKISFYDRNQDHVHLVTNYIVDCLDSINISLSISNARNNRQFIETRVYEVIDSLNTISEKLSQFMKKHNIVSLEDQVSVGVERAAMLQSEIISKEVKLEVAKMLYADNNPQINIIELELKSLRQKYNELLEAEAGYELFPKFSKVSDLKIRLIKFQREVDYYTQLLKYLGPQYEQQKFEEAKTIPTLQVLDKAVRPERKAKPKRAIIVLITMFVSGIFGMYCAYWKEKVARSKFLNE